MGGNGEAVGEVSIMRSWRSWRFEPLPIRFSPAQVGWFMTPADAFEMRRAQAQGGSSVDWIGATFSVLNSRYPTVSIQEARREAAVADLKGMLAVNKKRRADIRSLAGVRDVHLVLQHMGHRFSDGGPS